MRQPQFTENDYWHTSNLEYVIGVATDVSQTFKRFCTNCQSEKPAPKGKTTSKVNRWICVDCMLSKRQEKSK